MWTWVRGSRIVYEKERKTACRCSICSRCSRIKAAAWREPRFLTSDPEIAPAALMHNLKHNKVLHKRNIIMTIKTAGAPLPEGERM